MSRKKIHYAFAVLASGFLFSCAKTDKTTDPESELYVQIPDANFEKKLISLNIDSDGLINHKLLKTDAEEISYLDLSTSNHNNISDLTGIEAFKNLKRLDATQNSIETIDLSSNILLDSIYLAANLITNIDLTANSNLISIDIQSNELTSFTAPTNATQLKKINLSYNYLEAFSVHNESIKSILISDNSLTSFDVSGSLNLQNIYLKTNKIATIDLSENITLKTLILSDNKIQNINLDHNNNITHLYISSNLLTALNVASLPELVELKINNNPSLTCVQTQGGQNIPTVTKSEDQTVSSTCD